MRILKDIDVSGKRVFLRGDLDVSMADVANSKFEIRNSKLSEASVRLQNIKPTVDYLIKHGARQVIIAGHIGRPNQLTGNSIKPKFYDEKLSTKHLVEPLENLLGQKITFKEDVIAGSETTKQSDEEIATSLQGGTRNDESEEKVVLLENLRFWEGEEENKPEFAKALANLADVYVNDAFGVCHRDHASIVGVPGLLPHGAGLHLEQEIIHLTELIKDPKRPFAAIVGGAKIETKVPVIEHLAKIADSVLVGGEIAKELRVESGELRVDEKKVIVAELTKDAKDIDEESIRQFTEIIKKAKTIVWNGPMGVYEEGYDRGTMAIADAIIKSGCYSVVGGGETTEFLSKKGLLNRFSFVSSGGGAMLEYLSGKELPGIKALE